MATARPICCSRRCEQGRLCSVPRLTTTTIGEQSCLESIYHGYVQRKFHDLRDCGVRRQLGQKAGGVPAGLCRYTVGHFEDDHWTLSRNSSPLLGSQRRHRIHASGAVGREETSKKRRTREHQSCGNKRQRIARTYVIQDFGQDAPCSQ